MRVPVMRSVLAAVMWIGALVAEAQVLAGLRMPGQQGVVQISNQRQLAKALGGLAAAEYHDAGPDTGLPTPGPTDPNGPSG